jgi:hypothetical protein
MNKKLTEIFNGEKDVLIYCTKEKIYEIMSSLDKPKEYALYKTPPSHVTSFSMNGTTIHFIDINNINNE